MTSQPQMLLSFAAIFCTTNATRFLIRNYSYSVKRRAFFIAAYAESIAVPAVISIYIPSVFAVLTATFFVYFLIFLDNKKFVFCPNCAYTNFRKHIFKKENCLKCN